MEPVATAPATSATGPDGGGVPTAAAPPSRRRIGIVVVAVAVAVVLVAAVLIASGVLDPASAAPAAPVGTPIDSAGALELAGPNAANAPGGPWAITAAEGVGVGTGIVAPNWAGTVGSGCDFVPGAGAPTTASIDGTPSNATPGEVAAWIFFAKNASLRAVLLIEVEDGSAADLGTVSGSGCAGTFAGLARVSPNATVDSTEIARSVDGSGGSAFLSGHPAATELFVLIGASSGTGGPAFWEAEYSTCGFAVGGGSGTVLTATYYAASGNPLSGPATSTERC